MKYVIFSKSGDSVALWYSLGVNAIYYIIEEKYRELYKEMIDLYTDINKFIKQIDKQDIVYFDFTGFGDIGKILQDNGYYVYGGFKICDILEKREWIKELGTDFGIRHLEYKSFNSVADAIRYALDNSDTMYVVKVNTDDSSETFVPKNSPEESIEFMKTLTNQRITLAEKIEGDEITFTARFYKGNLLPAFDSTIEVKKLMNDDIGPNMGCVSSVILPTADTNYSFYTKEFLDFLKKHKYTGIMDINTIGGYFLEFTPRSGYNYEYVLAQIVKYDEYIEALVKGDLKELPNSIPCGLRVVNSSNEDIDLNKEVVSKYTKKFCEVYFLDLKQPDISYPPATTEICYKEFKPEIIYKQAENLILANKMYRTDAFKRALDYLKKNGIIQEKQK